MKVCPSFQFFLAVVAAYQHVQLSWMGVMFGCPQTFGHVEYKQEVMTRLQYRSFYLQGPNPWFPPGERSPEGEVRVWVDKFFPVSWLDTRTEVRNTTQHFILPLHQMLYTYLHYIYLFRSRFYKQHVWSVYKIWFSSCLHVNALLMMVQIMIRHWKGPRWLTNTLIYFEHILPIINFYFYSLWMQDLLTCLFACRTLPLLVPVKI